ncbi:hypothetical protein HMN09_01181000 [Mycena chlorophos]|uniref:Uncharacterized protein n=1 Tax=Mycena chlorophos TaxID=658473 RepID=A0A8H6S7Y7_MYCCL|nr:hypothetical protein HMN09_01181000 [Mycena chlorophos]
MANAAPRLPTDLERRILELTAELYPDCTSTLVLLAHRTYIWLEPYLYRHLALYKPGVRAAFAKAAAAAKPPSFFLLGPRRVDFPLIPPQDEELDALALCTGVQDVMIPSCSPDGPRILATLGMMSIRRMCIPVNELMPQPKPLDGKHLAFRLVSHLDLHDPIHVIEERLPNFLINLPQLTHLALHEIVRSDTLDLILQKCKKLQLLVFLMRDIRDQPDFDRIFQRAVINGRCTIKLAPQRSYRLDAIFVEEESISSYWHIPAALSGRRKRHAIAPASIYYPVLS